MIRLLACLLPAAVCACTGPVAWPVDVNLRLDAAPMQTRALRLVPGQSNAQVIVPGYLARTRLDALPDGRMLASVALFRQSDGASMGSLTSPPLDAGQAYDAYFVVCTDSPATLVTGGLHGQVNPADAPARVSCMPTASAAP